MRSLETVKRLESASATEKRKIHDMSDHARYGGSTYTRTLHCPPWAKFCDRLPEQESSEYADVDKDLIGDNLDADDDGDGIADDKNNNKIPDHEELDYDGDGFDRAKAVPWDAFPFDPNEWLDTDGDGIGDNADKDDDGDGCPDTEEVKQGTDPKDKHNFLPVLP